MVDEDLLGIDLIAEFPDVSGDSFGLPEQVVLTLVRLELQRLDRTPLGGRDERAYAVIDHRHATVGTRAELQATPLEPVGLDIGPEHRAGGHHEVPAGLLDGSGEHAQGPVVRRVVGAQDQQTHAGRLIPAES
ncbi:hypothetical protein BH24ACT5_BH24ACT5_20140 [soil metagenome]